MNAKRRRSVLFAALTGVVAWSAWLAVNGDATEAESDTIELARPGVRTQARPAVQPVAVPAKPDEAVPRLTLARANLFPSQTWYVPPPPPPPPPPAPPPPPPQAPPLPFSYMGRWQEAGQTTYYLMRGTTPVSVRVGHVLEGVWQLEPVSGRLLNFTYLPLNQMRSLRTGE
jgi:hypothetical protein